MATASHVTARSLVEHATRAGAGGAALDALAIPAAALDGPGRLPIGRMYRAWSAVIRDTGDAAAGARAAQRWTLDDLGLFGFCVAAAPTLGDALATAAAYIALVTDSGTWRADRAGGGELRMVWSRSATPTDGAMVSNEVMVAATVRCLRLLYPRVPLRVTWRHPAWQRRPAHADVLGCDVAFGAADDAIALPAADGARVAAAGSAALWRYLCALADGELAALAPPSLAERARAAIAASLERHGGRPDAAAIARALGTSERTLRRQLSADGTSLRALLAEACLARGAALLDRRASVTDAALDSGFSDGSAFARAWRRRHGAPPSAGRTSTAPGRSGRAS
jgi:AraC-like DNA-binding protein